MQTNKAGRELKWATTVGYQCAVCLSKFSSVYLKNNPFRSFPRQLPSHPQPFLKFYPPTLSEGSGSCSPEFVSKGSPGESGGSGSASPASTPRTLPSYPDVRVVFHVHSQIHQHLGSLRIEHFHTGENLRFFPRYMRIHPLATFCKCNIENPAVTQWFTGVRGCFFSFFYDLFRCVLASL